MLRGVDDQGANLVIAREYIAHGFRERAAELATLDLGPRTDREIQDRLRHDVEQERLTAIDRRLLRRMDAAGITSPAHNDPFQQAVATGRLRKLGVMGLAEDLGGGRWRLVDGLDDTLRRMGERGEIIRLMQRELTARKLQHSPAEWAIAQELGAPVIGRVVQRGLSDEHRDRYYLIVDGIDGRLHYIDIGCAGASELPPEGGVVRLAPRVGEVHNVDRTIARIAAANGGRYSGDLHLRHDPAASQPFAETHVRRLEAMRRVGVVERLADGSWLIASEHLDRAAGYEERQLRERPVAIEMLSTAPLERLSTADAATWLDRELVAREPIAVRDAGFGREVRDALAVRCKWLVAQGLAEPEGRAVRMRRDALGILQRRELLRVADELRGELSKAFVEAGQGVRIEGRVTRRIDLVSGRYALVERSREFTLVPWRPVLERHIGKPVTGLMRPDGVDWQIGRGRRGPEIPSI